MNNDEIKESQQSAINHYLREIDFAARYSAGIIGDNDSDRSLYISGFNDGALSQATKAYWYTQFIAKQVELKQGKSIGFIGNQQTGLSILVEKLKQIHGNDMQIVHINSGHHVDFDHIIEDVIDKKVFTQGTDNPFEREPMLIKKQPELEMPAQIYAPEPQKYPIHKRGAKQFRKRKKR